MSLKKKLMLIFSIVSVATLLVSSMVGYLFTKEQVQTKIQAEMKAVVSAHVNQLNGWLVSKTKMLETTAGTLQGSVGTSEITVPMLAGYKTMDTEILSVYFGSTDGKMVDGSGEETPAGYDPRTRDWYKAALKQGKLVFTDPYLDEVTKQMVVSAAMPYKNPIGEVRGVLAQDIMLQTLVDQVQNINLYGEGYAYLLDARGVILAHPDEAVVSKNMLEEEKLTDMATSFQKAMDTDQGFSRSRENGKTMLTVYQKLPATGWLLAITVPEEVVFRPLAQLQRLLLLVAGMAVIIVITITLITVKRITRPLETLAGQVNLVAGGDLTIQAHVAGRDEIAALAEDFTKMVHNLRNLILQVHTSAEQVAASSKELTAGVQESAQASNQVAGAAAEIAGGAEKQLAAVGRMSEIVHKMLASIQQVSDGVRQTKTASSQAANKAKESGAALDEAVAQMGLIEKTVNTSAGVIDALGERSQEIGQIVDAIAGIAGQTNLLALNAAIEAARAGEQGKGFAVVAEEVRKLAEQSQAATKKIAGLINKIQGDTAKAVAAMENGTREVSRGTEVINVAGRSFREIETLVVQVSEQIAEMSVALQQMNTGSQQIVSSVQVIDELGRITEGETQSVSAATEEQSASMQAIAAASQRLARMAEEMKAAVRQFNV